MGDGPLRRGTGIVEPIMAQFRSNKSKTGVGYDGHDKVQTSSKAFPKHNDSPSSTLAWVPKQKDIHTLATTDIMHDDDDDDSTKWEFESLSKESLHDKECDVVHIPTPNRSTPQITTQSSRSTSLRNRAHQDDLEEEGHVE